MKPVFYERYGFLCRAGDQRAVLLLMSAMTDGPEHLRANPTWALTGIAHRLGRERLGEALRAEEDVPETLGETIETLVDRIFLYSLLDVEQHFEAFDHRHPRGFLSARDLRPRDERAG